MAVRRATAPHTHHSWGGSCPACLPAEEEEEEGSGTSKNNKALRDKSKKKPKKKKKIKMTRVFPSEK
jgi:hypothetical protein